MTHRDGFPPCFQAGVFGYERVAWRCGASQATGPAHKHWAVRNH